MTSRRRLGAGIAAALWLAPLMVGPAQAAVGMNVPYQGQVDLPDDCHGEPGAWGDMVAFGCVVPEAANADPPTPTRQVQILSLVDGAWSLVETITPPEPDMPADEPFGNAIALHGDRLAVGCYQANTDAKDVHLYERVDGAFVHQASLSEPYSGFGASVALHGDTLLVGAPYYKKPVGSLDYYGYVFAYDYVDGAWSLSHTFDPSGTKDTYFGSEVALDPVDGKSLAIGGKKKSTEWDPEGTSLIGKSWLYERAPDGDWSYRETSTGEIPAAHGPWIATGSPNSKYGNDAYKAGLVMIQKGFGTSHKLYQKTAWKQFGKAVAIGRHGVFVGEPDWGTNDMGRVFAFFLPDLESSSSKNYLATGSSALAISDPAGSLSYANFGEKVVAWDDKVIIQRSEQWHYYTTHVALGYACELDSDCGTAFCVEGLCCESLCTDACFSCGVDGDEGHCVVDETVACDDGDACTTEDLCSAAAGGCAGTPVGCDDENPCTTDTCVAETGDCQFDNNTLKTCDDGDACTSLESCVDGACVGSPVTCDDENPCTDDACSSDSGCVATPNTEPCDDGDACTTSDGCTGGVCVGTGALDCDDAEPCTDDLCDPTTGCAHDPLSTPCDDGTACTTDDICAEGSCSGTPLSCDDQDPCTDDLCDASSGCLSTPNAADCDDGDACTTDDLCQGGWCGGLPLSCDDENPCTDDSCDPLLGCVYAANDAPCDDGDACTDEDLCSGEVCAGSPITCGDDEACTEDSCDPDSGCVFGPNDAVCDDENPCTLDTCHPQNGCVHAAKSGGCDDGDLCTESDHCSVGQCTGQPIVCADDDACTEDTCDAASGCQFIDIADTCTDGNLCTDDACDADLGCTFTPNTAPCDDGAVCTEGDTCDAGSCAGVPVSCDDGDPCTDDVCEPAVGCSVTPVSCDDDDLCTTDACDEETGECVLEPVEGCCEVAEDCPPVATCLIAVCDVDDNLCATEVIPDCCDSDAACDDGNVCTTDSCGDDNSCVNEPLAGCCNAASECNDGDLCTEDACEDHACESVPLDGCCLTNEVCDDDDVCTTDSCVDHQCRAEAVAGCCHDDSQCVPEQTCVDHGCVTEVFDHGDTTTAPDVAVSLDTSGPSIDSTGPAVGPEVVGTGGPGTVNPGEPEATAEQSDGPASGCRSAAPTRGGAAIALLMLLALGLRRRRALTQAQV